MESAATIAFALVLSLICPLAAGHIAGRKGRNAVLWAVFGLFLGIFGVLLALVVRPRHAEA